MMLEISILFIFFLIFKNNSHISVLNIYLIMKRFFLFFHCMSVLHKKEENGIFLKKKKYLNFELSFLN